MLQTLKILLRYFIIILTNKLKTAQLKMFQRFLFFRLLTDVVDKGCFEIVKDFVPQVEFLSVDLGTILKRVTFLSILIPHLPKIYCMKIDKLIW